jgi:hypothetical protein
MNTNSAALQGALVGGSLAILGSIISATITTRWTYYQSQLHLEATALVQAKQLCRQMLDLRTLSTVDKVESERKQSLVSQEMSAIAVQLRLRRHFEVAVKLWATDSSEDDAFYQQLSTDIGILINPKVQMRINELRRKNL